VEAGTTIKLYLPQVDQPGRSSKSQSDNPPAPRCTKTVLPVGGEDAVRDLSRHVLQGYS